MAVTSGQRTPRAPDPVHVLRGHRTDVTAVAFAAQSNLLLSGDADGEVKVWDLGVRRAVSSVRAHTASAGVIGLAASRLNPSKFVSQGRDGVVKVWAVSEAALARQPLLVIETGSYNFCKLSLAEAQHLPSPIEARFPESPLQPSEAEPSRDVQRSMESREAAGTSGRGLGCESDAGRLQKLESFESKQSATDESQLRGDNDALGEDEAEGGGGNSRDSLGEASRGIPHERRGLSAAMGGQSSGLAAGLQSDGQGSTAAGARSTEEGTGERALETGAYPVAADAAQQLVAVAGGDPSTIEIWDLRTGHQEQRLEQPRSEGPAGGLQTDTPSAGMCMSVQLLLQPESAPSPVAVGGYEDGTVMAWDLRSPAVPCIRQRLHSEPVLSLAVDRTGCGGISGSADDKVVFFNLRYAEGRGCVAKELPLGRPGIGDIALREDQRIVATAGWDHRVRIFDCKRRTPLGVLRYHSAAVTSVAFSPGGQLLASASRDAAIALWSIYPPKTGG
ncbi:WD40 domain-containing protein [Klebsormidium nitens]|uniref:WD40 domain-containing protein n=1 Tax=Klebsormidium nitens TaxID=105231 RepID=A0A1Y1I3V5_KLENI|nr:WD40 domain-containing protein [Klebsormidium nitens]|eukprot:GAQ82778.1 WD40 domain-containing protein [Klebsormidium nitens]